MNKVFKIQGSVKNYEWGKVGFNSIVAELHKSNVGDFVVKDIPYAELWMGTHISGPAEILSPQQMKLIDWVQNYPACLGKSVTDFYEASNGLPFLFKVLSVKKALSIQVHPDKESAKKLHKEFPQHYPDDNHKPEMAIALTDFEVLCGFRPLSEIKDFFLAIPQLKTIINEDAFQAFVKSPSDINLKSVFTSLMTCSVDSFKSQLTGIIENFEQDIFKHELCQSIRTVFLRIAAQYPDDVGCFCLFFLNYLKLKPNESIYLAANEPHAYLAGNCIECMACSDNVIRAGLTPKYKDVKTLCNMLTYICKPARDNIFLCVNDPEDPYLKVYDPPVNEFVIDAIQLPRSCNTYFLRVLDSASILLVIEGNAIYKSDDCNDELCSGNILFISCDSVVQIEPRSDMLLYRAHCSK